MAPLRMKRVSQLITPPQRQLRTESYHGNNPGRRRMETPFFWGGFFKGKATLRTRA